MTTAPALASRQRMNPRKSRSWTYEGMWWTVWTRFVLHPDRRLSEPELWSTYKIVRARISFKLSRTKISFKLARPEEPEFYSTGPGLEEEPVQSLKEATRALNLIDPVLKKRLFNHAAGMEIKVVTGFNSSCQGEDDAEDRHWWIQKPWKHRRIEISNKYITISNLKGIEADSKVLETLAHTKGLDK